MDSVWVLLRPSPVKVGRAAGPGRMALNPPTGSLHGAAKGPVLGSLGVGRGPV